MGQITKTTSRNQNGERSEDSYTYDAFGRMTSKTSHDGTVQSYTYDNNSNVLSYNMAKDGETKNSITYTYNSMDRLTELDNGDIIGYQYQYDNNGNLTLKLNTKTANFDLKAEYNAANLPIKYQTGDFGKEYNYSILYRVNGQKIYESDSVNDTSKTYDYNSLGQLEIETNFKDNNNVAEYDYTYDASGNRIKMRSFNNTLKKWDTVTDYTYNANNQLTESATKVNNNLTETKRYYYDKNGNTIAEQKKTYTTDGNIGSGMIISGREGSGSVKVYGYDYFNRLIKYNDGTSTAEYTYGADNLRTSKTVNGTRTDFVWNGQNLVGETKNGTETVYTYDQTGIIASKKGADTAESFFKDPHGDIIAISKGSNIIGTYDYTAFGNKWIGEPDPFGYCGEYLDSESGLIYLRNRYYNSNTGRFINEDPVKDGLNWYCYCSGNPILCIDPSGLVSVIFVASSMYSQAEVRQEAYKDMYDTECYIVTVDDALDFAQKWNKWFSEELANEEIDAIEIISHGGATGDAGQDEYGTAYATGFLYFDEDPNNDRFFARGNEHMNDTDVDITYIDKINKEVKQLNINGCNSANPDIYNVVYGFMGKVNSSYYSGFDGGARWDDEIGDHTKGYGEYSIVKGYYYVKHYQATWWKYVGKDRWGKPVRDREGRRHFYKHDET